MKNKDFNNSKYNLQILIRIIISISILLVWILLLLYLDKKNETVNIALCIFIIFILIIGCFLKHFNCKIKKEIEVPKKYNIIEISLLIFSAYLMMGNYTIYGFWNLIFKIINPSLIIGFIFVSSFVLAFFLPNTITRIIFIPLLFIYPLNFLTISKSWIIFGALLSSICLVEIFYHTLNMLKSKKISSDEIIMNLILIVLKIIFPIFILSVILFFLLGYEGLASYQNLIYIKISHCLFLLIPFCLFIILNLFGLNLKISAFLFLIGNSLTTFLLKDFVELTIYNNLNFIISTIKIQFSNNLELFLSILIKAIVASFIIAILRLTYVEWQTFNTSFKFINQLENNFDLIGNIADYELKFLTLKIAIINSVFFNNIKINSKIVNNLEIKRNYEILFKFVIVTNLKTSFSFLLPLNYLLFYILSISSFAYTDKLNIIVNGLSSCWSIYLNIVFNICLIFWDKLQYIYLYSWFKQKEVDFFKKIQSEIKKIRSKFNN